MDGTKSRTIKTSKLKYIRNFEIITTDINIALLIHMGNHIDIYRKVKTKEDPKWNQLAK